MHLLFKRTDGRVYGAYTGHRFLCDAVGADRAVVDELFREYTETAGKRRVQVGSFLFFALSRILSSSGDNGDEAIEVEGDEARIYRAEPHVVDVLRQEQGLVVLPDDGNGDVCKHCGIRAVVTLPACQLRSGDEPETYITQCAACGRRT